MDNNNLNDIPYDLILSDLDGTISEIDKIKVQNWRSFSKENEHVYNDMSSVIEGLGLLPEYQKLDTEAAWQNLRRKLETGVEKAADRQVKPKSDDIRRLKVNISVAAAILLIISFSIYFFSAGDMIRIAAGHSQVKKITMPDGSEILLNKKAEISYSRRYYGQARTINLLKGEAYFNVVHNGDHPFKVNVSHFEIRDVGTSFNVRYEDKSVDVTVNSGVVSLYNKQNQETVTLTANQKGVCDADSAKIILSRNDEMNYKAWTDHNFQFINYTMTGIVKKLSEVYGVRIELEDSTMGSKKLTLAFHNQNIDSVMSIIGETMQLKVEKKGDVFYLKEEAH